MNALDRVHDRPRRVLTLDGVDRRAFLAAVTGGLVAPMAAAGQDRAKVRRIGVLGPRTRSDSSGFLDAFVQGLRDLGWLEGTNIALEYRFAEGDVERLPALAADLLALKVDIILATSTPPALAAKAATRTAPIVMATSADAVETGLVASLAKPGGNITGLAFSVGLLVVGKGLELLVEAVPSARRVAVLSNPANPGNALAIKVLTSTARSLRVRLQLLEARAPSDFESAFAAMARERAGALLVVPDSVLGYHRARLQDLAARSRLPTMYGLREHVEIGGLMSYAVDLRDSFRRAATFVDKILKGFKPADLPIEQPTKFELVINLKTAKALGLAIPPSVMARADQVLE